ncbi:unnamed protein product [Blepharisma stoltei]|uniref:Uncharacterized protein n=1 Tax=Blepharisma stoltei TaxID=1481888 RepID=A0AAU9I8X0_9CILI|nr:unnamed protein product [Blepharisma stoltei]
MSGASIESDLRGSSPSMEDRISKLKSQFREIDANDDKQLTFEELHAYLTKKSGKPFNEVLLTEIFKSLDKDQNSELTLDEFAQGYYQAETLIKSRVDVLKNSIMENTKKLSDTRRQYIEAKANQGKTQQNVLTVTVKKAEGLKAGGLTGNRAPLVRVSCENQEITTQPVPNPSNPTWNETFSFYVTQGTEDISVEVFDTDRGNPTTFLGEVAVPFNALFDQQLHEDTLELRGKKPGDRISGTIQLALQWIHNLPLYLEGIIKQFEDIINEDKTELLEMEKYYNELHSALGKNIGPDWLLLNPKFKEAELQFSAKMDEFKEKTLGKIKWSFATQMSTYLLLLFSVLIMFLRPDFFNLTIGILALYYYYTGVGSGPKYKIIFLAILASEVYDLIWLYLNMSNWVSGTGDGSDGVKRFTVAVSVINLFCKLVFGAIFWKNSIEMA